MMEKFTYQKLEQKVKEFEKNARSAQTLRDENIILKEDNAALIEVNEMFAGQVNTLTVESEVSRLEFIQVFDSVSDPIWIIDKKNTILRVNQGFADLFKLESKSAAIGKKCCDLLNANICRTDNCPLKQMKNKRDSIEVETILEIEKGRGTTFLLTASPLRGLVNEIIGTVVQIKDISKRKAYEEALERTNKKLENLARIDGLTQIPNRRVFDEKLEKEWQRMQRFHLPISLILIDVDFFKLYNDSYGHAQGDECLKQIACAIRGCIHRSHDLAARYGGEEFGCILPETDLKGAAVVADSVLNAVLSCKIPHEYSPVSSIVTISIGCFCMIPEREDKPSVLIKEADVLLYKSKASGRNQITINR
jgi:diguanylate cyclase (GGDEF)-like protein/PAS domain S-box-containing protein